MIVKIIYKEESKDSLADVEYFPKYWNYDDIVVYALNFAYNNADVINDDFILFEDEIKKYKNENK